MLLLDSGHGGQTKDLDGDEEDGYDEVIYPVDFQTNGHIVDDVRIIPSLYCMMCAERIFPRSFSTISSSNRYRLDVASLPSLTCVHTRPLPSDIRHNHYHNQ